MHSEARARASNRLTLPVEGVVDSVGVERVERALLARDGVTDAVVNLASQTVGLTYDSAVIDPQQIIRAIRDSGYDVPTAHATFGVEGMHCAACVGRVEKSLRKAAGVTEAVVNLARAEATVDVIGALDIDSLSEQVEAAGYKLIPGDRQVSERQADEIQALRRRLIMALVFTVPLFLVAMLDHLAGVVMVSPRVSAWVQWVLATPVQFWVGALFYRRFFRNVRFGIVDMDTLVVMGTSAAYGYSTYVLLAGGMAALHSGIYFETAAVIVTLILFGRYLELTARQRTGKAIEDLAHSLPRHAVVRQKDEWVELPLVQVKRNFRVMVRKGQIVPVDGEVASGHALLEEASITGESVPAEKGPGDWVYAGTLNAGESFEMIARTVGSDTALAGVVQMVVRAQASKAQIQRLADRVAAIFVPVVLAIAALALAGWLIFSDHGTAYAVARAVAVLIIACPCALGLATPTAIAVATGRGAGLGVLFHDAGAIERALAIDVVLTDKTGTLTQGRPVVEEIQTTDGGGKSTVLKLAAAILEHSEHPLARAVVGSARERGLAWTSGTGVETISGMGVRGHAEGLAIVAGRRELLTEAQVSGLPRDIVEGASTVLVAADGAYLGTIILSDALRPSATDAVRALTSQSIETELISGDRLEAVAAVAEVVSVTRYRAEQMPEDKLARVGELQKKGKRVAFLGDGINDAPALAQADFGVAISTGADVAAEAAAVTLRTPDLRAFVDALDLARATVRAIHWNLFWAFGYNIIGIPLAAGLFVPLFGMALNPMFAALAMSFSSVMVVSNSLYLRRFKSRFPGRG